MPIEVKMAKLSPTMESGQMVKWLVKVGDKVKEGDTLAEIQTDKAVMPMESFDDGTVALLDVKEGDEIALGQRVLVLATEGEDPPQVASQLGGAGNEAKPSFAPAAPARETTNTPTPTPNTDGNGAGVHVEHHEEEEAVHAVPGGRVKVTPLARKIATEAGLDLAKVRGSGPNGRIIREDVEAFLQGRPGRPPMTAPAPSAGTRSAAAGRRTTSDRRCTWLPPACARERSSFHRLS